jgi:beta-phosphoglucomutase-like phosphatase (HAD superfamily)
MTTKEKTDRPVTVKTEITLVDFAMFFELEYTLVKGRDFMFEAVSKILKKAKKELTVPEFSRYCLYPAPKYFVPRLTEAFGLSATAAGNMVSELDASYAEYMVSDKVQVNEGMKRLIDAALEKGLPVCTLSALKPTDTQKLLGNVGLSDKGIEMFCSDEVDEHFPRADTWMKMARELSKSARRCVVFASSSRACKATLSAGMRSVAIPDAYTAFQDFGGAEMILEGKWDAKQTLEFLYPIDR